MTTGFHLNGKNNLEKDYNAMKKKRIKKTGKSYAAHFYAQQLPIDFKLQGPFGRLCGCSSVTERYVHGFALKEKVNDGVIVFHDGINLNLSK
jgi:hypothetical protein